MNSVEYLIEELGVDPAQAYRLIQDAEQRIRVYLNIKPTAPVDNFAPYIRDIAYLLGKRAAAIAEKLENKTAGLESTTYTEGKVTVKKEYANSDLSDVIASYDTAIEQSLAALSQYRRGSSIRFL